MLLSRWDPWTDMTAFQQDTANFLRRFLSDWTPLSGGQFGFGGQYGFVPAVEVFSREGDLVVRAELPGIDPEKDVEISCHENVLTIRGERQRESRHEGDQYLRSERVYGAFHRQILLPEGVNPDDIRATYEGGILEVVVPRAAELSAPKRIAIEAAGGRRKALTTKGGKK